jgi:signal recognition particle subunit SRP54
MFDILSQGFKDATLKLKGQSRLTDESIAPSLELVRRSLLDADVDLGVVKEFLNSVREKSLGQVVVTKSKSTGQKVSAGDHFVEACHEELLACLGQSEPEIVKNDKGPTVILLVGLQGAGKTTHAGKLAKYFRDEEKMRPLLVAADVYRPAARDQLKTLAQRLDIPFYTEDTNDAVTIARNGLEMARKEWRDLVIVDTAGRLAIDSTLMEELDNIKFVLKPQNIVLVIDAMIGQDAVRTASAFDSRLGLTGVLVTKLDGDARGGVALSVHKVVKKPILFVGMGEGLDKLERFRPEGMASRILGMGDIVGLMQDFNKVIDEEAAMKQAGRLMEGHFDFSDFLGMMQSIQKMGPIKDLIAKTPMAGQISSQDLEKVNDKDFIRMGAIVQSMTRYERAHPDSLTHKSSGYRSRIARIAKGSGRSEKEVKDLLDQFLKMRQMMQMFSGGLGGGGGGLLGKIPGLGGLNQLANAAKMMKQMGGMGGLGGLGGMPGMPGMPDMSALFGGGGMPGMGGFGGGKSTLSTAEMAELNRLRKRKKEEKQQKRKK